jgi:DNA-binding XRE family transcriptional regulator
MNTQQIKKKDILINLYKAYAIDDQDEITKESEIIKRYRSLYKLKVGNPAGLILDIKYTKKLITFITGDFRKFIIPFTFIKGWKQLSEKDKYAIKLSYASIIFGKDKLFFPFEEVLYAKDEKYKIKIDKKNAPQRKLLGQKIRNLRLAHGKKQKDIKGLSEREISRIENGHVWPSFKTQRKIAAGIGLEFKDFLKNIV